MGQKVGLVVKNRQRGTDCSLARVTELGELLFDEALRVCDSERDAAVLASARLLARLDRGRTTSIGVAARAG